VASATSATPADLVTEDMVLLRGRAAPRQRQLLAESCDFARCTARPGCDNSQRMTFQSLAPGFLIASPPLGDPNFDRTVVLLAVHNEDGALGFVVNRHAPLSVGELLAHADYDEGHDEESPVWLGGPVQPQSGWVISDAEHLGSGDDVIEVDATIRVSSSQSAFDRLAEDAAAGLGRIQGAQKVTLAAFLGVLEGVDNRGVAMGQVGLAVVQLPVQGRDVGLVGHDDQNLDDVIALEVLHLALQTGGDGPGQGAACQNQCNESEREPF